MTFAADGAVTYKPVPSADGATVVVDVVGLSALPKEHELSSAAVKSMTTDCWTTDDGVPMTRITVNLAGAANHWFEATKSGFTLMVEPASDKTAQASAESSLKATATAAEEMSAPAIHHGARAPMGKSSAWGEVTGRRHGGSGSRSHRAGRGRDPEAATPEPTKNDEGWQVPSATPESVTPTAPES
jgi:hypothetical protein